MEVETCGKPIDSLLEKVLCMNILSSDYFKELYRLKAYNEVIDEIYNQVDHVEPWMTGNCRGPSTAFCLLYKLFTMKLTVKQMQSFLNHPDSPYIRAVGFLYLRYVGNSKTLWGWYEQYIKDDEEFAPGSNGKMTTMGVYIRDLLLNQYYFDTLLPRVPVPIMRQITTTLERLKLPTSSAGVTGTGGRHASDDTARRPPSVKASLSVSFGQRAPHRASTRDSSRNMNVPRSMGAEREGDDRRKEYKGRDRDRDRETEKPREHDRDKNRDGVSRDRDRQHELRDYDQDSKRKGRDRDYESSGRDKDRDRGIMEGGRDYYSRDMERERDRERDRDRGKERERDSDRYRDRGGKVDYYRSRSRSPRGGRRYRSRSRSRSQEKFVRRSKSPTKASVNLVKLRDLYGDATAKSNSDVNESNYRVKDSSTEDVIRLGGNSWR